VRTTKNTKKTHRTDSQDNAAYIPTGDKVKSYGYLGKIWLSGGGQPFYG